MYPTLYRMHDGFGRLLYVGRTINPIERMRDHRLGKDWWPRVAAILLEQFDTLEELVEAEAEAIRTEHPIYNIMGDSIRNKIAAIGRQIDELWGNEPGTSLRGLYYIYWPPEECSAESFEYVYEGAVQMLSALRRAHNEAGGIPATDAVSKILIREMS
jgi:hypothetical protein